MLLRKLLLFCNLLRRAYLTFHFFSFGETDLLKELALHAFADNLKLIEKRLAVFYIYVICWTT